jgi:hypothetical protein
MNTTSMIQRCFIRKKLKLNLTIPYKTKVFNENNKGTNVNRWGTPYRIFRRVDIWFEIIIF